jgi:hypothetical protein
MQNALVVRIFLPTYIFARLYCCWPIVARKSVMRTDA